MLFMDLAKPPSIDKHVLLMGAGRLDPWKIQRPEISGSGREETELRTVGAAADSNVCTVAEPSATSLKRMTSLTCATRRSLCSSASG
jgi:hypothetical protein